MFMMPAMLLSKAKGPRAETMSRVRTIQVAGDEAGMRVDRWFKHRYPDLGHGRVQKLLRTGQVRVEGRRVKSGTRLEEGQTIRIPPLGEPPVKTEKSKPAISKSDVRDLKARVLYKDKDIIAINKPPGLAVQGGSGLRRHLDGMTEALRFGAAEKPRLVHRLDKDTSGVLVLARSAAAARELTRAFRSKKIRKLYWAVVAGVPRPSAGVVDLALAKLPCRRGERVVAGAREGKKALTHYRLLDRAGGKAAWVAFEPLTGRTHQLRVHAVALGTPILGDGKYGGGEAFIKGVDIAARLHLHARAMRIPLPGGDIDITAPLSDHMLETFKSLGFDDRQYHDYFFDINNLV